VTAFVTGDVFAPGAYEVALTAVAADKKIADVAAYEIAVRPP
jgi:protein involved in polysaccharide export with SLBB domain